MIKTVDELRNLLTEFDQAAGDPRAEEIADEHVRIVSEMFEGWSDNELGYLLTDIFQILRLQRNRPDILNRIIGMIIHHEESRHLLEYTAEQQFRSHN